MAVNTVLINGQVLWRQEVRDGRGDLQIVTNARRRIIILLACSVATFIIGILIGRYAACPDPPLPEERAGPYLPNVPATLMRDEDVSVIKELMDALKVDNIKENLRMLANLPHLAGQKENEDLGRKLKTMWEEAGLDHVTLTPYHVLLSYPDMNDLNYVELRNATNSTVYKSPLREPVLTPEENKTGVVPPFNAYSAPGDIWAAGVILFSDPADVTNGDITDVYPDDWWMPPSGTQRGTLYIGDGDPLSPDYPALSRWRPRRSIMFCSWGAEEYGLIGSTEWVEHYTKTLGARAVAYLNVDIAVEGNSTFWAHGTPMLTEAVLRATKKVPNPNSTEIAAGRKTLPGSGSDHSPFRDRLGVPIIDFGFKRLGFSTYPMYHSMYETFYLVDKIMDRGFQELTKTFVDTYKTQLEEKDIQTNNYSGSSFPGLSDALTQISQGVNVTEQWDIVSQHYSVILFTIQSATSTLRDVTDFMIN
ncbi:GCP2-like protein [Mya arenaria]|uniref:GCP2-like protein n=1 Tax=Mya arenaria TaxID=6604 RepID=A0ABY7FGE0_MYAAR|nr:GCP2-like protein [Mya arenaria]